MASCSGCGGTAEDDGAPQHQSRSPPGDRPEVDPAPPPDPDARFLEQFARQLVMPRNRRARPETVEGVDDVFRIPVGGAPDRPEVPAAELAVWVFEPRAPRPRSAVRTVLILHGLGDSKASMAGLAHILTGRGMRAVAVDLRGHGRSTGNHIAYGAFEAGDLRELLDALAAPDKLGPEALGSVGLYATSYGAHIAIQTAADPRIDRVVAVGAYRSLRSSVLDFVALRYPEHAHLPPGRIQGAVDAAGARAGFDPDRASAEAALTRGDARILLIHGTEDEVVPFEDARALAERCGARCRLHALPGADHLGSMRGPPLRQALLAWLEGRFEALPRRR